MKKRVSLPLQQLQPGMQVAEALADDGGRVLLPAGAELSETTIAALERRGIEAVKVELEADEDPATVERHRRQVAEQLDRLFRYAGDGYETRTLYETVVKYRMEHRP